MDILSLHNMLPKAIYDDMPIENKLWNIPVLHSKLLPKKTSEPFLISVGNNLNRKKISEKYHLNYINIAHPTAVVSSKSTVGRGTVIMANAVINPDATIGKHNIINTGSVLEHDCCLDDFVHISPNASLAGNVSVGEGTHIGIGATIIQGVKIGKWVTIGAGAVVIQDVPDFAVVVGVPGKIIKYLPF